MQKKKKISPKKTFAVKLTGTEQEGTIVAHFGAVAEVQGLDGAAVRCHLRKNTSPVITGDKVLWRLEKDQTGTIVRLFPRKSLLSRPESSQRTKFIAANIDAIIIVTAPPPVLSLRLLDRYIVAAENLKISPVILLNKIDLLSQTDLVSLQHTLAHYHEIGYTVICSSVYQQNGLKQLAQVLSDKTCVLVGVSGVGKSSIIRALTGSDEIVIGENSSQHLGKHTTTTTRLYNLPSGGQLIDSPGVREFVLWHLEEHQVLQGFIDFHPFLGLCKFRNCQHQKEHNCALKQAVLENKINPARWQSFQEILNSD